MKKKMMIMLVMVTAAAVLWAGGDQEAAGERKEFVSLTVAGLKGPSGFAMAGILSETPSLGEGVEVEYTVLPTPAEMIARITSGEVDAGVLPVNVAAKLYSKGVDYRLAAVSGLGAISGLTRDPEIKRWQDLAGKSVHIVGKGATPDFLMQYYLNEAGLTDPETAPRLDFSFAPPQLAKMIIAGKVDTVILPEPFVTMVLAKAPSVRKTLDFQEKWKDVSGSERAYPITAFIAGPALFEGRPDALARLMEAFADSVAWVNDKPAEAALEIEKLGIMAAPMAQAAIPNSNLVFIRADEARSDVEQYLDLLKGFEPAAIGGELPDDSFYLSE